METLRNISTINPDVKTAIFPNFSNYKVQTFLDLPQLYEPGSGGSVVNEENKSQRYELKKNMLNITDDLGKYMDNLIICKDKYVDEYNLCIKQMLLYLANNNFFAETTRDMFEGLLNINFEYVPIICQAYLVSNSNSNFNSDEQTIIKDYITRLYDMLNKKMMPQDDNGNVSGNNLTYGYGRLGFLCYFITNNQYMYDDAMKILKYGMTETNDDGTIRSEMGRQTSSYIYNVKAANFFCDMFYFRNTNLSTIENNKLKSISNLILDTFDYHQEFTDGNDKYSKKTNHGPQKMIGDSSFKSIHYDFIINILSDSSKEKMTQIYNKGWMDTSPFAIGF